MNVKCNSCNEVYHINEGYRLALILNSEQFKCGQCSVKEIEHSCLQVGINIRDNNGEVRPFGDVLDEVSIKFNNLET